MEKRTSWMIIVVLVAQLLVIAVTPAAAGNNAPAGAYELQSITIDSATMHDIAVLGEQMQSYLALNKDGTLSLGPVDPVALNITDEYLENYKAALEYINGAIKQGLFTVDGNFQVTWPEDMEVVAGMPAPESVEPDWGGYSYSHGLYVNFGYGEAQSRLPYYGLSTALSLASYCGRSYIAVPYTYQFTYYRTYRYYYQYNYGCCGGTWSYVPWTYLRSYSTCCYRPTYHYTYFWYPYGQYWNYHRCYW